MYVIIYVEWTKELKNKEIIYDNQSLIIEGFILILQ